MPREALQICRQRILRKGRG